jgi:hypothetical protein
MPFLQLTDESGRLLNEESFILSGTMAFPDDKKKRELFIARILAEESFHGMFSYALADDRQGHWKDFDECQNKGEIAGRILLFVLNCSVTAPKRATVNRAYFVLEWEYARHKPGSRDSIMKAWLKYRSVSHLWAARHFWVNDLKRDDAFAPDTPEGILGFLSIAEAFRKAAEDHRPYISRGQSPVPVFKPKTSWTVPTTLDVPHYEIPEWPPLTKACLEKLDTYQERKGN